MMDRDCHSKLLVLPCKLVWVIKSDMHKVVMLIYPWGVTWSSVFELIHNSLFQLQYKICKCKLSREWSIRVMDSWYVATCQRSCKTPPFLCCVHSRDWLQPARRNQDKELRNCCTHTASSLTCVCCISLYVSSCSKMCVRSVVQLAGIHSELVNSSHMCCWDYICV